MDERITTLESMMTKTQRLMASVDQQAAERQTPCGDFTVVQLQEHVAVWAKVFDGAVNDRELDFDPMTAQVGADRFVVFQDAAESIIKGLRNGGFDRTMTMTANPLPGEFVLKMLLMEYVGHGWDLAKATGAPVPFTEHEAEVALAAAMGIIEPKYRGTGMFEAGVPVAPEKPAMDRFVGFLGRNPDWAPVV